MHKNNFFSGKKIIIKKNIYICLLYLKFSDPLPERNTLISYLASAGDKTVCKVQVTFPCFKHSFILLPWNVFILDPRHLEEFVPIFESHKSEVISPDKFKGHPIGRLIFSSLLFIFLYLIVYCAR